MLLIGCGAGGDSDTPSGLATIKGQFVYRDKADWSGTRVYIAGLAEAFGVPVVTGSDGKFTKVVNLGFNYQLQVSENTYFKFVTDNINVDTAKVYDIGVVTMNSKAFPYVPSQNL